jgi:hypothetical protein
MTVRSSLDMPPVEHMVASGDHGQRADWAAMGTPFDTIEVFAGDHVPVAFAFVDIAVANAEPPAVRAPFGLASDRRSAEPTDA